MFLRKLQIERIDDTGAAHACPIAQLDNFAMRNFTNDAIFDDTLPIADGLLEAGNRIPIDRLTLAMEDWFRRKSYLAPSDRIRITELPLPSDTAAAKLIDQAKRVNITESSGNVCTGPPSRPVAPSRRNTVTVAES